ncbi:hypothetical protein LAZ67_21000904 [Cordylochernes scorpioides]|uniref:Uncharacterized protein n=1 Tax=Cordylochernes scorpioides TaxID=51811 RepID=A0ABY6LNE2_9ARAC|nr:hypothetical protein LAZ67_21000904 [Cordylochernes scorpioides]
MLEMTRTDPEWKDKKITGDETWVYGYDTDTKRQSAEWRGQDIAPNDFFLFPKLKAFLKGRYFDTRDDIIEKSLLALKSIPKELYKNSFDNLGKRWRWKSNEALHGYADADWGGNLVDRKSHTGIVYFLARGPIAWESKKQQTVTLSSTESEYIALCEAGKEAVYLRALLDEMGFGELLNGPTVLKTDNQGAQQLARNPVYHARTKHIDIKWHFIRSICSDGLVEVVHTPTQENVADILTKGLPRFLYEKHVTGFGM